MNATHFSRRSRAALLALVVGALALTGCESMNNMSPRERGTVQGAGIGAVSGAAIGAIAGGNAGKGALIGGIVGGIGGNLWSKNQEDRRRQMEAATRGSGVQVSRTQDNQLRINIPNDVSFDTGSAAIKTQMRYVLDEFAGSLRDDPNPVLTIIGHTDNTGSDAINDPLSMERAASVRNYLSSRGVNPSRVSIDGRGSREPIASNANDYGRAQNRRVEMFLRESAR